jgi:hypothetical protein
MMPGMTTPGHLERRARDTSMRGVCRQGFSAAKKATRAHAWSG